MALATLPQVPKVGGDTEVPRDGRGRPLIIPPGGGKLVAYTRMTTYIDCIEDKSNLDKWSRRMLLLGLVRLSPGELADLVLEVRQAHERQDKRKLNDIASRLIDLAGAHDKAKKGTFLHGLAEQADLGETLDALADEADLQTTAAYLLATQDFEIRHIEKLVVLDEMKVAGTPDRVVWYGGLDPDGEVAGFCIGDQKTGSLEYGGLKMSMQLSGYSRSQLYDPITGERSEIAPNLNQRWGLIFHTPAGAGEATVKWINLTIGWEGMLLARDVRSIRNKTRHVFQPFAGGTLANVSEDDEEDGE